MIVALALESSVMRAEDIQVKNWPEDAPCDAVKKNPDGSYTQTKELMMGRMRMQKNTFGKDTREAQAWDRKCSGRMLELKSPGNQATLAAALGSRF